MKAKFYWLFMLGKDLEHGCSRNLGPLLFTPALHTALIPKTAPFKVLTLHTILDPWHQNTYNPTFVFNWKKFSEKPKFKFKTPEKS